MGGIKESKRVKKKKKKSKRINEIQNKVPKNSGNINCHALGVFLFYTVLVRLHGLKPLCYSSVSSSMIAVERPASDFSGSSLLSS